MDTGFDFKPGDLVIDTLRPERGVGKVLNHPSDSLIAVDFKDWSGGHDCQGLIKKGSGGWFYEKGNNSLSLAPVEPAESITGITYTFSVKYCEEFTEDLFNQMLIWINPRVGSWYEFVGNNYNNFKKHGYFWVQKKYDLDKDKYWAGVDNNSQSERLISVSELKSLINYKELKSHTHPQPTLPDIDYFKGKTISEEILNKYSHTKENYIYQDLKPFIGVDGFVRDKVLGPDIINFKGKDYMYIRDTCNLYIKLEGLRSFIERDRLLEEAYLRYPPGTVYIDAADSSRFVVEKADFDNHYDNGIRAEAGKGLLYYKGEWAEIVSPQSTEKKDTVIYSESSGEVFCPTDCTSLSAMGSLSNGASKVVKVSESTKSVLPTNNILKPKPKLTKNKFKLIKTK